MTQTCPYQKPRYLTEDQKANCYATNRGWVLLYPNGKYDIIESIAGLDVKIAEWEKATGIDTPVNDLPVELKSAKQKHDRKSQEIEVELAVVNREIKEVEKKITKEEKKAVSKKQEKEDKDAE